MPEISTITMQHAFTSHDHGLLACSESVTLIVPLPNLIICIAQFGIMFALLYLYTGFCPLLFSSSGKEGLKKSKVC